MTDAAVATYSPAPTPVPTLLLALGSEELTEQFSTLLRNAGFGVLPAASPDDAQRLIAAGGADMALLDVEWGPSTVTQLAQAARSGDRPCQVAVVVGWWDARTGEVAGAADTFVYKPPTQRQLLGAIQHLLEPSLQERLPA